MRVAPFMERQHHAGRILFIRPRRTWVRAHTVDGRTVVEVAALDRVSGGDPGSHVEVVAATLRPADQEERE